MPDGPRILVTSVFDWWSTYRAVYVLARAGARVETLADLTHNFTRSRYVARAFPASRQPAELAASLQALLERDRYDWIIVADDLLFTYLGGQPNPWWVRPWFAVVPRSRAFDFCTSKLAFAQLCRDGGIPVPQFATVTRVEHALDAAREFGYPVIGKTVFGFGGRAVRRLDDAQSLESWWQDVRPPALVQRFIAGRPATTEMLFERGRIRAYFSSLRSNFWPTEFGTSSTRVLAAPPGIAAVIDRLGEITGIDGFCNICWMWGDDGAIYLSELNPRPTPGYLLHPEITDALVAALRDRFSGAPVRVHAVTDRTETVQQFPEHFSYAAVNGGLRAWYDALASLRNAPWSEPAIALAQMRRAIELGRKLRR